MFRLAVTLLALVAFLVCAPAEAGLIFRTKARMTRTAAVQTSKATTKSTTKKVVRGPCRMVNGRLVCPQAN